MDDGSNRMALWQSEYHLGYPWGVPLPNWLLTPNSGIWGFYFFLNYEQDYHNKDNLDKDTIFGIVLQSVPLSAHLMSLSGLLVDELLLLTYHHYNFYHCCIVINIVNTFTIWIIETIKSIIPTPIPTWQSPLLSPYLARYPWQGEDGELHQDNLTLAYGEDYVETNKVTFKTEVSSAVYTSYTSTIRSYL